MRYLVFLAMSVGLGSLSAMAIATTASLPAQTSLMELSMDGAMPSVDVSGLEQKIKQEAQAEHAVATTEHISLIPHIHEKWVATFNDAQFDPTIRPPTTILLFSSLHHYQYLGEHGSLIGLPQASGEYVIKHVAKNKSVIIFKAADRHYPGQIIVAEFFVERSAQATSTDVFLDHSGQFEAQVYRSLKPMTLALLEKKNMPDLVKHWVYITSVPGKVKRIIDKQS